SSPTLFPYTPLFRSLYQKVADDGAGTRKGNQCQCKGHEKQPKETTLVGLLIHLVYEARGERDFKCSQKGNREHDDDQEKQQVERSEEDTSELQSREN